HLRPEARRRVEKGGWLSRRRKAGRPVIAVTGGWCVFFNEGCVLHKVGAAEGNRWRYKPSRCITFPLERLPRGQGWYVRQWGVQGEAWDLFCLNPGESPSSKPAETLAGEIDFIERLESGREAWRV